MRGALLVCKKEFLELGKDRKTLFFTFVLPLLLYPLLFGMIGKLNKSDEAKRQGRASRLVLVDPAHVLTPVLKADPRHFELVDKTMPQARQALTNQDLDLIVEVEAGADAKLGRQETFAVKASYDQSEAASRLGLTRLQEALKKQNEAWVSGRLKALGASSQLASPSRVEPIKAGDEGRAIGKALGSFLPYILMIMMFAGAMQHGIYATAGEKERGTIQSLLATSLPRNQIILGKLIYVFSIGLLSALVNLVSMGFAMGRMVSDAAGSGAAQAAAAGAPNLSGLSAIASPVTLGLSFLLMIPLGLLFANLIILGGIQARNTVEAGTALTPGIILVVVLGVFTMAPGIEKWPMLPYIPVVNVSIAIRKLFSQQGSTFEYLVALGMTVGLAALLTWISTRLLNRESAIFKV